MAETEGTAAIRKTGASACAVAIEVSGDRLTDEQRATTLIEIAAGCPVRRTLGGSPLTGTEGGCAGHRPRDRRPA